MGLSRQGLVVPQLRAKESAELTIHLAWRLAFKETLYSGSHHVGARV
jgi:hypothetical protein